MTKVAVFTPTRHPGISVAASSVLRQTTKVDYWLIADQLDRDAIIRGCMPPKNAGGPEIIITHLPIKPGNRGNLAACDNWALDIAYDLQVDALIFLQDFIWMPSDGVERFLKEMDDHPFALHTGTCHMSTGPAPLKEPSLPEWSIFPYGTEGLCPPQPWIEEPRTKWGYVKGRVSSHAWEINYGAMPYSVINSGLRFDEDYDKGTQWENTQFAFDVARNRYFREKNGGYVWFDTDNVACGMPHRQYFPAAHEGEREVDNGKLFWSKNPDLMTHPEVG